MPPLLRRLVAVLVVLLLLGGVAILSLRALGMQVALDPLASDTPKPLATPAPSDGAVPSASREPEAVLAEIEEQVRDLRALPAPDIGPVEFMSRDELEEELRDAFDADYPEERRRAENLTLRALGLLDEGQDVADLQLTLLSQQVIGFYDDTDKRMVIVADAGLDAQSRITYAHEYTHALQDAAFGLDSLAIDTVGEDDRNLARLGLVEGDATLAMSLWAITNDPAIIGEIAETPIPDMSGIPVWMVDQLTFPYVDGARFTAFLYQEGGYDLIDAAFADPPASTEQVLHPREKYLAGSREDPIAVDEVDLASALGAGWQNVPSTTLGEALIAIWLEHLGVPTAEAADAGSGWGGDRVSVAGTADGDHALALRLVFDAPAQADDFERSYGAVVDDLPFAARMERSGDSEIVVAQASDEALLDRILAAAD